MNDNQDQERARALERVRKMLRLANDAAASEGERDNALRMAHATLAKWNLDIAEAESNLGTNGSREDADRGKHDLEIVDWPWRRSICAAVGRLLFCEVYFVRTRKNYAKMYFVGRGANAKSAIELADYLIRSCLAEAKASYGRAADAKWAPRSTWELDFCKGAAHAIYKRCEELRKHGTPLELAKQPGTALVLANHYANEQKANLALMQKEGIMLRKTASRQRGTMTTGAEHGRAFGNRVQLQRRLG